MSELLFPAPPVISLPISGVAERFPVGRIFCVGRNYAAHAAEMGAEVDRDAPFYFLKNAQSVLQSGQGMTYPPQTGDLHHEVEFCVALSAPLFEADASTAMAAVYGYGLGLDMTRRDLQQIGKDKRRPWDLGKDFDGSAILAPITPIDVFGSVTDQHIALHVNGALRQSAALSDMVHNVQEILMDLSRFYALRPGDIVMTGTPAGVGPVVKGDQLRGSLAGLDPVVTTIL